MPTSVTDGGERLIRVETKLDDFIQEFRRYVTAQIDSCQTHVRRNEEEHEKIWIVIDDFRTWKLSLVGKIAGAGFIIMMIWAVVSAVVTAYVLSWIGI